MKLQRTHKITNALIKMKCTISQCENQNKNTLNMFWQAIFFFEGLHFLYKPFQL
jgi:hypothetical protein